MASIAQPRPAPVGANPARNPNFRTPLFLVGVGLALFAFLAMLTFGLIFASKSGSGAIVTVVVASEPIEARDPLTPDVLATVRVPQSSALQGAYTNITSLRGFYALVDIPKGQAITSNVVAADLTNETLGASGHINIPPGYIIVTLPTSEQQGVAGFIAQGDYIDIMVTLDKSVIIKGATGSVTRTVFTSVYVVRIGPETSVPRAGQAQGVTSSITLLMSQCDAQYMYWFSVNATIKYTLISAKDYPGAIAPADASCPSTVLPGGVVGPVAVESRYGFLKG